MPPPILLIHAHPDPRGSRINRALLVRARELAHVTVHELYETYPDFHIDVVREQALLAAHDAIVFQHPFYWYSVPALLKEWLERVLSHGFAFGRGGDALRGKEWWSVISTGGGPQAYGRAGKNRYTVAELLTPLETTARYCGMRWRTPLLLQGAASRSTEEIAAHAEAYRVRLADWQPDKEP